MAGLEAARLGEVAPMVDRRHAMAHRQQNEILSAAGEERRGRRASNPNRFASMPLCNSYIPVAFPITKRTGWHELASGQQ